MSVYLAVGTIMMSLSLALYTALHQLKCAPNVQVRKSRRETIPEVENPGRVVEEAHQFINKSLLRKEDNIQDPDMYPTTPSNP